LIYVTDATPRRRGRLRRAPPMAHSRCLVRCRLPDRVGVGGIRQAQPTPSENPTKRGISCTKSQPNEKCQLRESVIRVLITILALLLPACASQPASSPVTSQTEAEDLFTAKFKEAGAKATQAIEECKRLRLSGKLKTYVESANCSNPPMIAAYQNAEYPSMDLIQLLADARLAAAYNIDMHMATEPDVDTQMHQLALRISAELGRRAQGSAISDNAEVLLRGLPALKSDKVVVAAHGDSAYMAASAGCIKKSIDTCLKNLQTGFRSLPLDNVSDQMKNNDAVDVNGKRIRSKNLLLIAGYLQGWTSIQSIDLTYTPNRIVDYIGISLPGDPDMANTTEEYEKTGLYEAMRLLLGSDCQSLNRDDAFKFFQNSVKPRIVREGRTVSINDTNAEITYFQKAIDIPLCGLKFSYMKLFGYDTNDITIDNPHGAYIRNSITFE
jgi:hypothetical protein